MTHLSPLDAAFLDVEDADRHSSLAIASVAVVEGPAPGHEEFLAMMRSRLPSMPHATQKVERLPLDLETPRWADDPSFDLGYHVRRTALPAPGGDEQLCDLVARVMAHRLDRERPLWECWVVEGLSGGRWAVLSKVHHCLVDGVGGAMLYDVMYGGAPVPDEPAPEPSTLAMLYHALRDPLRAVRSVVTAATGLGSLAVSLLPVRATSLFGPIGTPRRYRIARASLTDVKVVARAFGVTVNDVVLAAVSTGYRTMLLKRGETPSADSVRTMVPVSVRGGGRRVENQISVRLSFLPVEVEGVVETLSEVHQRLSSLKAGNEAEAGQAVTELARHEPFAPLSWGIRLGAMLPQRSIVTVTTNVPGPREELRILGRRIVEILPYVPIAIRIRTGVAVLSYHDRLAFGITADYDSTPDVDVLAEALERAIAELVDAART